MTTTIAIVAAMSASVGSFTPGTPSSDPALLSSASPFEASVAFVSSSAGATGMLYFAGAMSGGTLTPPAAAADPSMGLELFANKGTDRGTGDFITLGGFDAGATIHFNYLVTKGVSVAPTGSLFSTQSDHDPAHFVVLSASTIDATTTYRVGIEDIRNPNRSDWDYNDIVVDVTVRDVPTPGATVLALAGFGLTVRRRR